MTVPSAVVVLGLLCGCACTDRHHLATTNWVDRSVVPDSRAGQWAMTPLLVPLCVGTLAVDNLIVAPVVQLPSAWEDAEEFFRKPADERVFGRDGLTAQSPGPGRVLPRAEIPMVLRGQLQASMCAASEGDKR